MSRSRLVLAAVALLGAGGALLSPLPSASAKDDPKAAKEAKEAEERKKDRNEFREKQKKDGKHPTFDLTYAADPAKAGDTRWAQSDPPHPQAKEDEGLQLVASWSPSAAQSGGISIRIAKYPHSSADGKSTFSMTFEKAGIQCKTGDVAKMVDGTYGDWTKELKDVHEKKSTAPKKSNVGPASLFASVVGTDPQSQKRERRDVYAWLEGGCTWMAYVTFSDKYLDDAEIMVKAEEYLKTLKKLKAPK